MCLIVLRQGVRVTHDLEWPPDQDLYRDAAQAQSFCDGRYGADPFYRGETLWYSPLAPFIVATVSRLLDRPVALTYARLGAYLNVLGPVCFYLLTRRLLDRWSAAAAIFAFLFLRNPSAPSYTEATYSPWLLSAHAAQPLFYLGLLVLRTTVLRGGWAWHVLAGLLLGLTFLAHTAPALVLGMMTAVVVLCRAARRAHADGRARVLRQACALWATAGIVSLPLLWSIAGRYGLRIRNAEPMNWRWPPDDTVSLGAFTSGVLSPVTGVAVLGAILLAFRSRNRLHARLLLAWPATCFLLLAYAWLAAFAQARGLSVPNVVPAFHFTFWAKAAESALFGYGLGRLCYAVARLGSRLLRRPGPSPHCHAAWARALLVLSVLAMAVRALPAYRFRADFVQSRHRAQKFAEVPGWNKARRWIRANTSPEDVFLATDDLALFVVGPSGRRVVALMAVFSNPYVAWAPRNAARNEMFRSLRKGDAAPFRALAREYGVTWVIVPAEGGAFKQARGSVLALEFAAAGLGIHRVLPAKEAAVP